MTGQPFRVALSGQRPRRTVVDAADGVGMIRGEYVMRSAGAWIDRPAGRSAVAEYAAAVADAFAPKPVWYRTSDFEEVEVDILVGDDRAPFRGDNPILSERGVRRGRLYPDELAAEIEAVASAARTRPNLHLMFSYVGDADDFTFARDLARASRFPNELGTMVEVPAAAMQADELCRLGATNLTIGTNDLTTLLLGAERSSQAWRKSHPVLGTLIGSVVAAGRRHAVPVSIAGYLRVEDVTALGATAPDHFVFHYHELGDLMPGRFALGADDRVLPAKTWAERPAAWSTPAAVNG